VSGAFWPIAGGVAGSGVLGENHELNSCWNVIVVVDAEVGYLWLFECWYFCETGNPKLSSIEHAKYVKIVESVVRFCLDIRLLSFQLFRFG
jgi:hypothetical protein